MIKINLLAEGKRPTAVRRAKPGVPTTREWGNWLLLAGILIGVLGCGGWWWVLRGVRDQKAVEIKEAEAEVKRLESIIKEVQDFKRKQAELERKISVIKQLQANQRGPVQVMDQVSRALPELLWLDRMTLIGTRITLAGHAFNSNAVANFLENLDKVPQFQEPVLQEIREDGRAYKFTIVFNFSYPSAEPAPAAAGSAPAAAPPPARAATAGG